MPTPPDQPTRERVEAIEQNAWTPGPWSTGPAHVVASRSVDEQGRKVTRFVAEALLSAPHGEGEQEAKATQVANAALIASAPDLFAALEDFDNWFSGFNPEDQASRMEGRKVIIRARAALTRAKAS